MARMKIDQPEKPRIISIAVDSYENSEGSGCSIYGLDQFGVLYIRSYNYTTKEYDWAEMPTRMFTSAESESQATNRK